MPAMNQSIRVLVGDDDVNDRFFLEWGFKQVCPYVHLDFARTGDDVIQHLEEISRPKPALLIIDSMMPRRDGYSVLAWLRTKKEFDHLPIVMLSGQPYDKNEARARELGVRAYIGKPHDLDELKALVQDWKQKYLDPIRIQPAGPNLAGEFHLLVADSTGSFRVFIQKAAAEVWPDAVLTVFPGTFELLKHFEENSQPAQSLLLLDLGTTSLDALKWLRRQRQLVDLPIIVWTRTPVDIEEQLAREYGATAYMAKPDTFASLLEAMRELARRYSTARD